MRFTELIKMVWLNIIENKVKVLLTSLGIIVGSATIVLVIAVGRGGQADVADQFKNLNAGAIEITSGQTMDDMLSQMMENMPSGGGFPGGGTPPSFDGSGGPPSFSGGQGGMPSFGGGSNRSGGGMPSFGGNSGGGSSRGGPSMAQEAAVRLTAEDAEDILAYVPNIEACSIITSDTAAVDGGDLEEETEYTVAGVLSEYMEISNLELMQGDFLTEYDNDDKAKVAVIGYTVAQEIFGSAYSAYGEVITIEGKNYDIIGVLSSMGTVSSGISSDEVIYIPFSTSLKYVFGSNAETRITAVASDVREVETVISNIEAILTQNYPSATFTITDAGSKMEAATASADTLSMLLTAVASIVFVVGGIGIMNVLFVTVKERTQEIGLLKALGTSKRAILIEFLLEACFISFFGGIAGVAAGFGLVPAVELLGMRLEPSASGGILALVFAVLTGTIFGFYPAFKASKLTPIEALTQD